MKSTGRWASLLWALLLAAAGAVLCFVPLFNLLGYESSLVLAVLGSLAGVRQGALAVRRAQARPAGLPDADSRPLRAVLRLWLRGIIAAESLLLPPLALLLLNGLQVRNCSYAAGFAFFAMLPVLSIVCAVAVGEVAALLVDSPRRALLLAYGVLAGSLCWSLLRFFATPAIYAYDPFFGYFPGALYDEEVAITGALFAARLLHLLTAFAALALVALFLDGDELRFRFRALIFRRHRPLLALALPLCLAALLLFRYGGRLGIYTDAAALNQHLYREQRTPHFAIRYRPGGPVARDIALIAREHELRYAQLRDLLGVEPDWRTGWLPRLLGADSPAGAAGGQNPPRLVSYLFDSALEKRRWMGAGNTYIAKPWRREIYLQHEAWPHPVLRHELAHLFAGAAGDRFLRMALSYGVPQPGMIEGLAVAADWRPSGELSGHQVVLAMRRAGLEPPLTAVVGQGIGFWRLPGGRAYAVAGSFCRFLLERYGAAPLLAAYQRGGGPAEFAAAFQVPFETLAAEWRRTVDEQPMKAEAQEVARERLRRKAVFHKVCAHELALRKEAAHAALGRGDIDEAIQLLGAVCHDDPDEPQHQAELVELLAAAGRLDEAARTAQVLLGHPGRTPVLEARAVGRLGDLAVLRGDLEAARTYYRQAEAGPQPDSLARLTTAKLAALASEHAGPLLLRVLVGPPAAETPPGPRPEQNEAVSAYTLTQAALAEPTLGLPHYVLGRLLFERGGYSGAEQELARSLELGLPDERFSYQALLLRGQAALLSGHPAAAATLFEQLGQQLPAAEQGRRLELEDMRDRARRWLLQDSSDPESEKEKAKASPNGTPSPIHP